MLPIRLEPHAPRPYNARELPVLTALTNAFPLWLLLASGIALVRPELFTWFGGPFITIGLGVIMLSMGMTVGFEDFRRIARERTSVLPGVALQYTLMPLLGWSIGWLLESADAVRRRPDPGLVLSRRHGLERDHVPGAGRRRPLRDDDDRLDAARRADDTHPDRVARRQPDRRAGRGPAARYGAGGRPAGGGRRRAQGALSRPPAVVCCRWRRWWRWPRSC